MAKLGDLLASVQETFFFGLNSQTNWGKEQVKRLYLESQNKVLRDSLIEDDPEESVISKPKSLKYDEDNPAF